MRTTRRVALAFTHAGIALTGAVGMALLLVADTLHRAEARRHDKVGTDETRVDDKENA